MDYIQLRKELSENILLPEVISNNTILSAYDFKRLTNKRLKELNGVLKCEELKNIINNYLAKITIQPLLRKKIEPNKVKDILTYTNYETDTIVIEFEEPICDNLSNNRAIIIDKDNETNEIRLNKNSAYNKEILTVIFNRIEFVFRDLDELCDLFKTEIINSRPTNMDTTTTTFTDQFFTIKFFLDEDTQLHEKVYLNEYSEEKTSDEYYFKYSEAASVVRNNTYEILKRVPVVIDDLEIEFNQIIRDQVITPEQIKKLKLNK